MNNKLNFEGVINPNEFGGLLYDNKERDAVSNIILNKKAFRYAILEKNECDVFEEKVKKIIGSKYSLCVNNGTSGLKVALKAVGINKNDRVLVSSYTFISSATSVINMGAVPIPMNFSFDTGIDLIDLEKELKKGAKAVIVVHIQGRCFDISKVVKMAHKYKTVVIEDACQAFGSLYNNRYAGTFGDIGVFSFQQNKLITSGEGGMIVTNNKKYYDIARNFHDMGSVRVEYPSWEEKGALIGDNYRMTNISAAILNVQLDKLDYMIKKQKFDYEFITRSINSKLIIEPNDYSGFTGQNILLYINNEKTINEIIEYGEKNNIEVRKIWNMPYDQRKVFKRLKLDSKSLKKVDNNNSNDISKNMISITICPTFTNKEKSIMKKFVETIIRKYDCECNM